MVAGYMPFNAPTVDKLIEKIINVKVRWPKNISPGLKDLLSHIMVADPDKRYTIADIKNHPWFKMFVQNELIFVLLN